MEFIDKIPRSLSGKILRRELKEKVTAALLNVVNNRANEEEQNVIRSKNPDVEIPDNLSWAEFVFQHFDEYEDREAMVRSITGCFLFFFFMINRPSKQFSTFTGNGACVRSTVVSWLARPSPDRAVTIQSLAAGDIVLYS